MSKNRIQINNPIFWLILIDCLVFIGIIVVVFLTYSRWGGGLFGIGDELEMKIDVDNLQELRGIATVGKEGQALVASSLVSSSSIVSFVQSIEAVGKKSGTELKINQAENQTKGVTVRARISGDFPHLIKALKLLENLPFLINFNRVIIQKNGTGSLLPTKENLLWSADVDFTAKTLKK